MGAKKEQVKLSDGRIATLRRAKVRDIASAENQPKGKEYLAKYAAFAKKIQIDGKDIVQEDIMDLYEDDFLLLGELFPDDEKNA